jgi:hypothetical protein
VTLAFAAWAVALDSVRAEIVAQARAMEPLVQTRLAKDWLRAAERLPAVRPRTLYRDQANGVWSRHPGDGLQPFEATEDLYYMANQRSPVAFARAIDLAGRHALRSWAGRRILNFGYGGIGQLKMMAWNGAEAIGVDTDPMLKALYGWPGDSGEFGSGHVRLLHGRWPGQVAVREGVGGHLHLFLSMGALSGGSVRWGRSANPEAGVGIGINGETFLRLLHDALRPDGVAIIYNLCPPCAGQGRTGHVADGRNPFPQRMWEEAGFEVVAFDSDDSAFARTMARALGWHKGAQAVDSDNGLSAWFSVLRKPR